MLRKFPLFSRLVLIVLLPLGVAALIGFFMLRSSLPQLQGSVIVSALKASVKIARDSHGVPVIVAENDDDAFFAMGYAQAQDRMWQLELQRRIVRGRLSEIFGKSSVDQDVWFRTLGLVDSAKQAWTHLGPAAQASLRAYAAGVNQWIDSGHPLPPEFRALGITPEHWTVYDSLAWVKVFSLYMSGNYQKEIQRLLASELLNPAQVRDLFPDYVADSQVRLSPLTTSQRQNLVHQLQLMQQMNDKLRIGGRYVGSNAWVVSPRLSKNGQALLANDPHLGLQIPSLWYMVSMDGGHLHAQGASLVGLPMVVLGHNRDIGWAATNLMGDAQDLYFERIEPGDPSRYAVGDRWVPLETHEETIKVRQDFPRWLRNPYRPLRIQVRRSRHGPIVSDVFHVFDAPTALRWTTLDEDDTSYDAFLALDYATDWTSFQAALKLLVAPSLNMLYADRKGNIGYWAAGRLPVRSAGDGTMPVPGADGTHEWIGNIPFDALPHEFNPKRGYLVSANNNPVSSDYPYLITRDWAPPARAERIATLLKGYGNHLDPAAMARIQADTISSPARKLLPRLLAHHFSDQRQARAYSFLKGWNGNMGRESQAATIFNVWVDHLRHRLVANQLASYWNRRYITGFMRLLANSIDLETLGRMLADSSRWCDNRSLDPVKGCDAILNASLNDALDELGKVRSDRSMQSWAWGELHHTTYRHIPFSDVNILRDFFERQIGNGGSPDTVNVASYGLDGMQGYSQTFGAGVRQIMAFGPQGIDHRYMNSTGQSGNVFSQHYNDMVEPFRDVEYFHIPPPADLKGDTLTLTPSMVSQPQDAAFLKAKDEKR